jgi:predicted DNA binding CopG/RHH family protein
MANKKTVTISAKPSSSVSDPAQIDQWVSAGEESNGDASQSVKMKRLTLDISEDLHKAIKTWAVVEGVPMANMLRSLLEENYGNQ